jgi:SAM-dependent methyltransferase
VVQRPNAVCPVCQSRDRHRLAWLWLCVQTPMLVSPMAVLHVAPEGVVARRLRALRHLRYVSGDLVHRADLRMDLGRLPFADGIFDLLYCSHVLNMLPDDRPALAEIFRVLRPGGHALIQVPAPVPGSGIEAGAASTREDRERVFGDPDMYRRYGRDDLGGAASPCRLRCAVRALLPDLQRAGPDPDGTDR